MSTVTTAVQTKFEEPGTALVVIAHPDDGEFSVAGTIAGLVKNGWQVVYVVCTDGSRGSNDPLMPPFRMAPIRHHEQFEAARALGVQLVTFLDYEDGTLQPTLELRRDLTRAIRCYRPDIVFCQDPTRSYMLSQYINHPDHRAVAEATLYAVFPSACTRFIFSELLDEGFEPHKVRDVYLYGAMQPDMWVDITENIEAKVNALMAHRSQVGEDREAVGGRLKARSREVGQKYGVEYAEEFKRLTLVR